MRRKPKAVYRVLLREAWDIVSRRPSLWVFGFFATVLSSGGIFEIAYRSFKRVTGGRELFEELLSGSIPGYDTLTEYIRLFGRMEPWRQQSIVAIATLFGLALLCIAVASQVSLLLQADAKKPLALHKILLASKTFFWRVLGVAVLSKACMTLMLMAASLPLILYVTDATARNALVYLATFVVFFPAAVAVGILTMLALVSIVRGKRTLIHAIEEGIALFKNQWLVILELGAATFLVALAVLAVTSAAVAIEFLVASVFLVSAVQIGSVPVYVASVATAAFVMAATVLVASGFQTAFQYTVWLLFWEKAARAPILAKLERLWAKIT
jgi:hypothetical protein